MNAKAENFGDLDQDHEDDFASFLRPKTPRDPAALSTRSAEKAKGKDASTQRAPQEPSVVAGDAIADQGGTDISEEPSEGRVQRPRRGRPPGVGVAATSAKLVLWTPVSIRTRMQRVRAETGKRYADQILDALEATVDDLPDLIAEAVSAKQVQGRLFDRRVETEVTEEVRKQLTVPGVTASHLAVIDDLVASTGAGSRSKLVNVALDEALPPL